VGLVLAALSAWLMGGCEMADGKGAARARRSRPAQIIGSQRTHNMGWQANKVNVALPFSMIRAEEPAMMRVGDWISLAGLVVSAIGFSIVIRKLVRIAHASDAGQVSQMVSLEKADSRAGGSSSPDAGDRVSRT
jgi:hypothetical protein